MVLLSSEMPFNHPPRKCKTRKKYANRNTPYTASSTRNDPSDAIFFARPAMYCALSRETSELRLLVFLQRLKRLVESVFEVVIGLVRIGFLVQCGEGYFRGLARLKEAARAHGFQSHERMVIVCLRLQQVE